MWNQKGRLRPSRAILAFLAALSKRPLPFPGEQRSASGLIAAGLHSWLSGTCPIRGPREWEFDLAPLNRRISRLLKIGWHSSETAPKPASAPIFCLVASLYSIISAIISPIISAIRGRTSESHECAGGAGASLPAWIAVNARQSAAVLLWQGSAFAYQQTMAAHEHAGESQHPGDET